MKLTEKLNNALSENKVMVNLSGKEYQLNVQNAINALIDYHMENPDLGEPVDYDNDSQRKAYYKKQFKKLDVETVKEQIQLWHDEDEMPLKWLKQRKVI